jgi:hypothetical protein
MLKEDAVFSENAELSVRQFEQNVGRALLHLLVYPVEKASQ